MNQNEQRRRSYFKEEEFCDEYYECAHAAGQLLGDDWQPNTHCSDKARHNRDYFLKSGELANLTFNSADINHVENGFSSAHIFLGSSHRSVTIRVEKSGNEFIATITNDQPK
jgi:hypothetical protein